jgi:hypothetical protein
MILNENKLNNWVYVWFCAITLTGSALVYQSFYDPTKPKREQLWLNEAQDYRFRLPRSHSGNNNCLIEISIPDVSVNGDLFYRRYPTKDEWQRISMVRVSDKLAAFLPVQPPSEKLEYYLKFNQEGRVFRIPDAESVVIRFQGDVPAGIILPHAVLMVVAMLLSNLTLFLVIFRFRQYRIFAIITLGALIVGGLILGPLVQKYAFGQYWTGFSAGMDITDSKTLITFIFWAIAVAGNLKKDRKYLVILASIVMLILFSIPHSSMGSERDPETGKIKTGMGVIILSSNS